MKNFNLFKNDTLCIICAKSESQGLPNKNIKLINNFPLIYFAIKKAKKNNFKYICVSTDSKKIAKIAKTYGVNTFYYRSKKLCKPTVPKILVWKDAINKSESHFKKKFNYMLDIEVTNPLIDKNDLSLFSRSFFQKHKKYDGLFCYTPAKKNPYFNLLERKKNGFKLSKKTKNMSITARQKAPETFEHVAGLYYFNKSYILKCKSIFDGKIFGHYVSLFKSFDIDNISDFKLVELILNSNK
jgi:CMP-N,N'-diacetyllegionaminic acid synthase